MREKWAYHMAGVAWEKGVYPPQVDNIGPSSAACINLLLASLLSLSPSRLLAKHQQGDNMQGVRLCYSALLSLDSQCQDNNFPCLLASECGGKHLQCVRGYLLFFNRISCVFRVSRVCVCARTSRVCVCTMDKKSSERHRYGQVKVLLSNSALLSADHMYSKKSTMYLL